MVAPQIVKELPKAVHTNVGEITILEAKAFGKPKPQTKWLKGDVEIHESKEYHIEEYPDGTSILTIKSFEPEQISEITFEASNPLGVAETVAEIRVEGIFVIVMNVQFFFFLF